MIGSLLAIFISHVIVPPLAFIARYSTVATAGIAALWLLEFVANQRKERSQGTDEGEGVEKERAFRYYF
jgi:hypothetical protein